MEQYGNQNNKKRQYYVKNCETCALHISIPAKYAKYAKNAKNASKNIYSVCVINLKLR